MIIAKIFKMRVRDNFWKYFFEVDEILNLICCRLELFGSEEEDCPALSTQNDNFEVVNICILEKYSCSEKDEIIEHFMKAFSLIWFKWARERTMPPRTGTHPPT